MRRKTFDVLVSTGGLLLVVVLAVAGGLLTWAHDYTGTQVHNQLAMQQITFPATNNPEFTALPPADRAAMAKYANQPLLTGAQAQTYADHFIAYHLSKMPMGGVYSKVSAAAQAAPAGSAEQAQLQKLQTTVFQGTTLRGLLLSAYAFGTMGVIAGWAAIAAFASAGLMLILSAVGLYHSRRVGEDAEILPQRSAPGRRSASLAS